MIEKGQLVPNVNIVGPDGTSRKLWDFRQKCHVLLLVGEAGAVSRVSDRLAEQQKTLIWLGVEVVPSAAVPEGFSPGAFAIDRFGELVEIYPLDESVVDRFEKDFIYHEACRC